MNRSVRISDMEKWQAVVNCDMSCDSIFFYGVKTTGIFCRPSCRAKTPLQANVIFFDNSINAIEAGFRPCKKCRTDKMVFEPDLELVKKARDIFDINFAQPLKLDGISKQLGVSSNHLVRLFKTHNGLTPTQYITELRVYKAAELLRHKDIDILEIAYMTGFKSLSNFYRCFKVKIGFTPREYRNSR